MHRSHDYKQKCHAQKQIAPTVSSRCGVCKLMEIHLLFLQEEWQVVQFVFQVIINQIALSTNEMGVLMYLLIVASVDLDFVKC